MIIFYVYGVEFFYFLFFFVGILKGYDLLIENMQRAGLNIGELYKVSILVVILFIKDLQISQITVFLFLLFLLLLLLLTLLPLLLLPLLTFIPLTFLLPRQPPICTLNPNQTLFFGPPQKQTIPLQAIKTIKMHITSNTLHNLQVFLHSISK